MPEETTAAPSPTPSPAPNETLPPTVAPATDTPAPTLTPTPTPANTPAAKPTAAAPTNTPGPSGDDRNQQNGQITRNWEKYPLFDMKHPDRRLNMEPDPDCEAPDAGTPMFFLQEESELVSV